MIESLNADPALSHLHLVSVKSPLEGLQLVIVIYNPPQRRVLT